MADMPIGNEYAQSVCEIKSMDNALVAIGRIKRVTEEYIRIYNGKNELRVLNFGEELKINIFNTKLGFKVVVGKVYTSTEGELSVADVSILTDRERRNFFRVDMELDATVIYRDRGPSHTLDIKILDMSLSGLRFKANHEFKEGSIVSVEVDLRTDKKSRSKLETFPCKIVRIIENEKNNELQFGCVFTHEPDEASDSLCSFLFKKQREFLNSRKNDNMYL